MLENFGNKGVFLQCRFFSCDLGINEFKGSGMFDDIFER